MKIEKKLLLKPGDFKPTFSDWRIDGVLNPGVIRLPNNDILLYVRVAESHLKHKGKSLSCPVIVSEDVYKTTSETVHRREIVSKDRNVIYLKSGICRLTNISHFRKVVLSSDGMEVKEISNFPDFTGNSKDGEYGVEDPRIVKIGGKYYMTYVSVSKNEGVSSSLAVSKNLKNWSRKGIIFREQNKDVVLFPEKVGGKYVALNRPEVFYEFHRPAIWIAYSHDLVYWGKEKSLILPREDSWESERVGAGAPPIKTKKGWLLFYHGVKVTEKEGYDYSVGVVLLDLKNPGKIIAKTSKKKPLITVTEGYERMIEEKKRVVFPTGVVMDLNGKDLLVYYGAGDRYIGVIKMGLEDVLKSMEKC